MGGESFLLLRCIVNVIGDTHGVLLLCKLCKQGVNVYVSLCKGGLTVQV